MIPYTNYPSPIRISELARLANAGVCNPPMTLALERLKTVSGGAFYHVHVQPDDERRRLSQMDRIREVICITERQATTEELAAATELLAKHSGESVA